MKKIFVLSAVLALSACGCFSGDDAKEPVVEYQNVQARPQNCDYFDGGTCYRYTRRIHQPAPVRYREPTPVVVPAPVYVPAPTPLPVVADNCAATTYVASTNSGCAPQVRETKEPVEVVYKKTTYTTVFEPKTSAAVSYERAPYAQAPVPVAVAAPAPVAVAAPVEIITPAPAAPVEIVTPASTKIEIVSPSAADEEILLNVK